MTYIREESMGHPRADDEPTVQIKLTDEMIVEMWTAVAYKAVHDDEVDPADLKRLLSTGLELVEALMEHIHELEER